jgi:hypothetical protein
MRVLIEPDRNRAHAFAWGIEGAPVHRPEADMVLALRLELAGKVAGFAWFTGEGGPKKLNLHVALAAWAKGRWTVRAIAAIAAMAWMLGADELYACLAPKNKRQHALAGFNPTATEGLYKMDLPGPWNP